MLHKNANLKNGSLIFHDFCGNKQIAENLLRNHNCFFSFGKSLFRKDKKAFQLFYQLPKDNLLLETDAQNDLSIERIYSKAASALNLSPLCTFGFNIIGCTLIGNFINGYIAQIFQLFGKLSIFFLQ